MGQYVKIKERQKIEDNLRVKIKGEFAMKIKSTDVLAIIGFSWALYYINFDKEAVKAFITGGVIVWWVMKRVM